MRTLILLVFTLGINSALFGQFTTTQSPYFDVPSIYTSLSNLNINGKAHLQTTNDAGNEWTRSIFSSNIFWNQTTNKWVNTSSTTYRDFAMMRIENGSTIGFFANHPGTSSTPVQHTNAQMENYRIMTLTYDKKVGIGTKNPDELLTVKGTIHAEEVIVDLNVPADYVFEKYYNGKSELNSNYTMPTLEEVEAYTKANNHLPEMPSAKEIQEEGLHLSEMTNLLLQKIEELTLYTIEQEKRIQNLESPVSEKK